MGDQGEGVSKLWGPRMSADCKGCGMQGMGEIEDRDVGVHMPGPYHSRFKRYTA